MNIVLIGVQGSGKGTQAAILSEKWHIPHISAGDLLRNLKGKQKKEINAYMVQGKLIPDALMVKVLENRLKKPDCKKGCILDGFPRTLVEAKALEKKAQIDMIIEIKISDKEAIKRIEQRVSCKCGAVYNLKTTPPQKKGVCDRCHEKLFKREDDYAAAIKRRIAEYHKDTLPLLKKFPSIKVKGEQPIKMVAQEIMHDLRLYGA